jgi:hypothetical protein
MPAPSCKLIIELAPGGRINVSGPLHDKMLCYGMLESAKDSIRDYQAKAQSPILVPEMRIPSPAPGTGA